MPRCTFQIPSSAQFPISSGKRVVEADRGDTLLDAALAHGVAMPHECGGNCACTTCHVVVQEGAEHLSGMEEVERDRLGSAEGLTSLSRLGCQAILLGGPVVVTIVESEDIESESVL